MYTTKMKHRFRGPLLAACLFILAAACRKEEFQQPPHGEPVPHTDTARYDVGGLLQASAHKLFAAAWRRSHMDAFMTAQPSSFRYTVLAPDDAAMRARGLDEAGIAAKSPDELDTLLKFHVLEEQLDTLALRLQHRNTGRKTLLVHGELMEMQGDIGTIERLRPYVYKHWIGVDASGALLVDGKNTAGRMPMFAKNGVVWPVNRVLELPRQHTYDLLMTDPQFSMLGGILHWCDSVWLTVDPGWIPRVEMDVLKSSPYSGVSAEMFFAPTNAAFAAAGFHNLQDLIDLNMRSLPYLDWDWYEIRNGFVTDTLLGYHMLGRRYAPSGPWGQSRPAPAAFFSNDLNPSLANFPLHITDMGVAAYYMPLAFTNSNGRITVATPGNRHTATVVRPDILTFQGPVHAVDKLLIPENLQLP